MLGSRAIASVVAATATLLGFAHTPAVATSTTEAFPSVPPGSAAACTAAEHDLAEALDLAVNVCPEVRSTPTSPTPAGGVRALPDSGPASESCLPTTHDRCEAWVSAPYDGAAEGIDRVGNMLSSGNSMAVTPDGTMVFTAGDTDRLGPSYSLGPINVLAFDSATGGRVWTTRFQGPDERPFATVRSVVANDGAVFVTGYTNAAGKSALGLTLAYDSRTGAPLWQADFPGVALASAISADRSLVFVVGEQEADIGGGELRAVATVVAYESASGRLVWSDSLIHPSSPLVGWRVDTAPGLVTVLAGRVDGDGYTDGVVLATYIETEDPDTEAWQLRSRISVPVLPGNLPAGLALSADGSRAFIVQDVQGSGADRAFTAAFDTVSGTMLWTALYDGDGVDSYAVPWFFHPIDVSPDGESVYIVAQVDSNRTNTEGIATVAYRTDNGERRWAAIEQRVSPVRCVASCGPILSVNPTTGRVVVAGASLVGNRQKAATWAYAPDGTLQWFRMASALPENASVPIEQATESAWTSIVSAPNGPRVYVGGSAWAIFNDPSSSEDVIVAAFETV